MFVIYNNCIHLEDWYKYTSHLNHSHSPLCPPISSFLHILFPKASLKHMHNAIHRPSSLRLLKVFGSCPGFPLFSNIAPATPPDEFDIHVDIPSRTLTSPFLDILSQITFSSSAHTHLTLWHCHLLHLPQFIFHTAHLHIPPFILTSLAYSLCIPIPHIPRPHKNL